MFESGKYDGSSGDKIDVLEVLNKFDLTALLQSPKELLLTNFITQICMYVLVKTFDKQASEINSQLLILPRIFTPVDGRTSPGVRRPNRHDLLCAGQQWKGKFLVVYLVG